MKLDSLHWFYQRRNRTQVLCTRCIRCDVSSDRIALFTFCVMCHDSAKHHILGGAVHPGGGYNPKIPTRPRFMCNAPTPKFHQPMFTRSEVIVLTNKHTHKPTNRHRWKYPTFFATLRHWVITQHTTATITTTATATAYCCYFLLLPTACCCCCCCYYYYYYTTTVNHYHYYCYCRVPPPLVDLVSVSEAHQYVVDVLANVQQTLACVL